MKTVRLSLNFILCFLNTYKYASILKSNIIHMAFSEDKQFGSGKGDDLLKWKEKEN